MDEMMNLVNGIGMNAAEVTRTLSEIGGGNMLDGISNIYNNALEYGQEIGYTTRLFEEALETPENNIYKKVVIGGACFLVGAGITAGGVWLAKKLRTKKEEAHTQSEKIINDTCPDKLETDFEQTLNQ